MIPQRHPCVVHRPPIFVRVNPPESLGSIKIEKLSCGILARHPDVTSAGLPPCRGRRAVSAETHASRDHWIGPKRSRGCDRPSSVPGLCLTLMVLASMAFSYAAVISMVAWPG
jgi:hypothetical protein